MTGTEAQSPSDIALPPDAHRLGVAWLDISTKTANTLMKAGVVDVHQIYEGRAFLHRLPGIGPHRAREILAAVSRFLPLPLP